MASRFWRPGGSGEWNASDTNNWSATSGGATGASVPVTGDTATFDGNSGTGTCIVNVNVDITSLTCGNFAGTIDFSVNNNTFKAQTFSCTGTANRVIHRGTNTWELTGNNATIWNTGTATNLTIDGTGDIICSYAGSVGTRSFSIGTLVSFPGRILITAGTDTFTIGMSTGGSFLNKIDFTGFTGILGGGVGTSLDLKGDLTLGAGMTTADTDNTHGWQFTGASPQTITFNGVTFHHHIFIGTGAISSTVNFADDILLGSDDRLSLTQGVMNPNNHNVTVGLVDSSNSNTRTFSLGSGAWTVTGAGSFWNFANVTGLTFNKDTANIKFTDSTNTASTFAGGGKTYNDIWFARGASTGTITITGSNTYADIKDTGTAAHSVLSTASTTNTYTTFNISGTPGNVITFASTTTTNAIWTKAGGGVVNAHYLNVDYITANPDTTFFIGSASESVLGTHNTRVYLQNIPMISGKSAIKVTTTQTILGKTRVGLITTKNITGGAYIVKDPQTGVVVPRLANVADYGYVLENARVLTLDARMQAIRSAIGRIPALWHDAEYSVVRNCLRVSDDLTHAAWGKLGTAVPTVTANYGTAPDGTQTSNRVQCATGDANSRLEIQCLVGPVATYTVWMKGTGRVQLRLGYTGNYISSSTIILTGTWTMYTLSISNNGDAALANIFCDVGGATTADFEVWHPQVELGATYTVYGRRSNNTAAKSLNLGTANATGDGTYGGTGGAAGTMLDFAGIRRVYKTASSGGQIITTPLTGPTANRMMHAFVKRPTLANASVVALGTASGTSTAIRPYRSTSIPAQAAVSLDGNVADAFNSHTVGDPGVNVWFSLGLTYAPSTVRSYAMGIAGGTGSVTATDASAKTIDLLNNSLFGAFYGWANHLMYDPNNYSAAEMTALHEALKADVGFVLVSIAGKSRIQVIMPRTILGKARITVHTPRTILGMASISKTIDKSLSDTVNITDALTYTRIRHPQIADISLIGDEISIEVMRGLRANDLILPKPHQVTLTHTEAGVFHEALTGTKTWDISGTTRILTMRYEVADYDNDVWEDILDMYHAQVDNGDAIHLVWDYLGFDDDCLMDISASSLIPGGLNRGNTQLIFTHIL